MEGEVLELNPILQYNGIVLLNGYVQRLFVFEKVHSLLTQTNDNAEKMNNLISLLDTLGKIETDFTQTKKISEADVEVTQAVLETTRSLMKEYICNLSSEASFDEKIAIAASTIYAEEHINNGVIELGKLFNPDILDRYMQQIPYHQNRVALVNRIVHKKVANELITESETQQIDKWYSDVIQNKAGIDLDLNTIQRFLKGKR